jgi:hypothetical protein
MPILARQIGTATLLKLSTQVNWGVKGEAVSGSRDGEAEALEWLMEGKEAPRR